MAAHTRRTVIISGRKTSISLEGEFWIALKEIAAEKNKSASALVSNLVGTFDVKANLSAAVRCYILAHYISKTRARLHSRMAAHLEAAQ